MSDEKKKFSTELPKISVIVPVYNGENFLFRCLGALRASNYKNFEIIVVDDGSTDASASISRAEKANVITTDRPQSGPAAARNLAARTATGDVLLFVDADVVVKRDTLRRIAEDFRTQPEISAVFGSYDAAPAEKNFLSQYRNLLHHFVHQNSSVKAATFWAGLGAIRRSAFEEIGGFDAHTFGRPSIEDIELGCRLSARGHQILLDKNIQGRHLKKWTVGSMIKTDVFNRALPWSKLILTRQGMINDLNLKTNDRVSALLVALMLLAAPLALWQINFLLLGGLALAGFLFFNRRTFQFFCRHRGIWFAVKTIPWQMFFYFYSGASFVYCWLRYRLFAVDTFKLTTPTSAKINRSNRVSK